MSELDISIVVGYKDWGLRRLVGAVRSLQASLEPLRGEVIVSDYGSLEHEGYREAIEAEGAVYVRTETDGVWSRSRALNAGLCEASGKVLVTTDADMVFTPKTFPIVVNRLEADPAQYVIMQCNDLPEGIDHEQIEAGTYSWRRLNQISTLRPRWGMGGMIAVPRDAYLASRGLDERMQIYGGEDIDFARRMRRLGLKLHWLEDADAQMYHVWHPSSRESASQSKEGLRAINHNRDIQLHDRTASRNLTNWQFPPHGRDPLVSVVISTYNRAEHLKIAILSVLAQTVNDFELIIIDDGSTDDTAAVVASFDDVRIRYFARENAGLASARNFATSVARGRYIAVMDDDDVMLPSRLEVSLGAITDGVSGSYGGWVDFDDATGERQFRSGKALSQQSLLFNSGTYLHPTLLIERKWMLAVPYDETLRSGSDYNMAMRMARSGVRLVHCGSYVLLRRNHEGQITATDPVIQKSAGAISAFWGRAGMLDADAAKAKEDRTKKDKVPVEGQRAVEPDLVEYLSDRAVVRSARVRASGQVSEAVREVLDGGESVARLMSDAKELVFEDVVVEALSLEQLLILRALPSLDVVVETRFLHPEAMLGSRVAAETAEPDSSPFADETVRVLARWLSRSGVIEPRQSFFLASGSSSGIAELLSRSTDCVKLHWRCGGVELSLAVLPIPLHHSDAEVAQLSVDVSVGDATVAIVSEWEATA